MSNVEIVRSGNEAAIGFEAPLGLQMAGELRPLIKELVADGVTSIVLDLARVAEVDSSGIGLLVATHNSLKTVSGGLRVINASADILYLLRVMRLDRHFTVEAHA